MGLYDKISKMSDEPGIYDEKLYRLLIDEKYTGGAYCRHDLGEGMEVVDLSYPSFNHGYHNGIAEVQW